MRSDVPACDSPVSGSDPAAERRLASAIRSRATADSLVGKALLVWPRTSTHPPCVTAKASGTSQKSCAESAPAAVRIPTAATAPAIVVARSDRRRWFVNTGDTSEWGLNEAASRAREGFERERPTLVRWLRTTGVPWHVCGLGTLAPVKLPGNVRKRLTYLIDPCARFYDACDGPGIRVAAPPAEVPHDGEPSRRPTRSLLRRGLTAVPSTVITRRQSRRSRHARAGTSRSPRRYRTTHDLRPCTAPHCFTWHKTGSSTGSRWCCHAARHQRWT